MTNLSRHPGATQSYWHREAILAAEGDWRFFETLHPPSFLQPAKRNWRDAVVLASRSDTGKGEAFTGGGMFFLPRTALHISISFPLFSYRL